MIQLIWDAGFKRSCKKRIGPDAQLRQQFRDALERFVEDPSLQSSERTSSRGN